MFKPLMRTKVGRRVNTPQKDGADSVRFLHRNRIQSLTKWQERWRLYLTRGEGGSEACGCRPVSNFKSGKVIKFPSDGSQFLRDRRGKVVSRK